MKIKKLNIPKKWPKLNNVKVLDDDIKSNSGIYLLFNKDLNLLYIGKTENFRSRLLNHISPKNNSRYDEYWGKYYLPLDSVKYYSFMEIEDEFEKDIIELLLIKTLKPEYNFKKHNKNRHKRDKVYE